MAAEYDFKEKPNPKGDGEKQALYPRIVVKGKITTKQLAKEISEGTTFSEGEIRGIMTTIASRLAKYVSDGYSVELEDIGFFTASLTARPVMDKKEIRATSVSIDGVNFRMSKGLKGQLRSDLVRAKYGFNKSSKISLEKRKALLDAHLEKHNFITRITYSEITGLLKGLALKDLNRWVEEGYLKSEGNKSSKVFLKNNNIEK